jgi:hypothetical protein
MREKMPDRNVVFVCSSEIREVGIYGRLEIYLFFIHEKHEPEGRRKHLGQRSQVKELI